jgi:hypothetical protein
LSPRLNDPWFYRLLRRTIGPVAYVSLLAVALALMRAGHIAALKPRDTYFSPAWTSVLFLGGCTGLLFFLAGWLILYWPGRAVSTPPPVQGESHTIEDGAAVDAVSTLLLAGTTLRQLVRVNEAIQVGDGYYQHDVTSEWLLPTERDASKQAAESGGAPPTFYVPVVRIARPRVVDNMVVETAFGERLSPCNSDEFAKIVKRIVEQGTKALTGGTLTEKLKQAIDHLVRDAQFDTGLANAAPGNGPRGSAPAHSPELVACLDSLPVPAVWKGSEKYWEEIRDSLRAFCNAVGDAYMIFVPLKAMPGDRVVLRHTYTRHHQLIVPKGRERARLYLGLRPHTHRLTTQEHVYAQSYHLRFVAPEGQYVFGCRVEPYPELSPKRNVVVAPVKGAGARDYAHVYVRPYESPVRNRRHGLRFELDCREKPPGLLGIVALVAIAQALLIWVVGKFYGTYFPAAKAQARDSFGDVPALLLAVPGLAAAWLGSQFTGQRLRATSLATIVGVLVCGAIAILSTAAAVSRTAGTVVGSGLGIEHPVWVLFMLSSWVLAFDLTVRTFARSWRFTYRLLHPDDEPAFLA